MTVVAVGQECIVKIRLYDQAGPAYFKGKVDYKDSIMYHVIMENGNIEEVPFYDIGHYDESILRELQRLSNELRRAYRSYKAIEERTNTYFKDKVSM